MRTMGKMSPIVDMVTFSEWLPDGNPIINFIFSRQSDQLSTKESFPIKEYNLK